MISDSESDFRIFDRILILGTAILLSLNIFPGRFVIWVVLGVLIFLFIRMGLVTLLAALSLSGLFLLALIKQKLVMSASLLVLIQTFLTILLIYSKTIFKTSNSLNSNSLKNYRIWIIFLYILILVQYLLGPRTSYSDFLIQYFLLYASYYIITGFLVVRFGIKLDQLLLPSVFFLCLMYPLINISIIDLPKIMLSNMQAQVYGLRMIKGYGAIGHDRIAAQTILLICLSFVTSQYKNKILPEIFIGIILALPIIWFGYSRQSLIGTFFGVFLIFIKTAFQKRFTGFKTQQKYLILLFIIIAVYLSFSWISTEIDTNISSRYAKFGILKTNDESSYTRLSLWKLSWKYIQENPIFGYGLGGFGKLYARGKRGWPHNWFLESWIEYGIFGLIIFIIGAFYLINSFLKNNNKYIACWSILGLFWLFVVQVSSNIPENSPIFFFITIAALSSDTSYDKKLYQK